MDKPAIAKIMLRMAKTDVFNGKGRVIPEELLKEYQGNPKPTTTDLILAWKETYPDLPIEQKMNVLIIIFGV